MAGGFYCMQRGWLDHPVLAGEFGRRSAWAYLIEHASWQPREVEVRNKIIALERGQLVASIRFLAEAWGWRRDKAHRFLRALRNATMIQTEDRAGETVITICNYDLYQIDPSIDRTANRTQNRTADRTKYNKGIKEGKKDSPSGESIYGDPKKTESGTSLGEDQNNSQQPSLPALTPAPSPNSDKRARKAKRPSDAEVEKAFDEFWTIIPKRTILAQNRKDRSSEFFRKHIRSGVPPDVILDGARREREWRGVKHEFAIAPQNWLRDRGWQDNEPMETDDAQHPTGQQVGRHHQRSGKGISASQRMLAGGGRNLSREHPEPEDR